MMDHRENIKGALGAFLLFGLVAAAGTTIVFAAVEDFAGARASLGWPAVEGVILSRAEDDHVVRYAWFDGEASHTGERIRFWTQSLHPSGLAYAPGDRVEVRYSPENGGKAVLEPGGSPALFAAALGFGAILVFVGLAGIVRLTMMVDGLSSAVEPSGAGVEGDALVERRSSEFDLMERRRFGDRRGEYPGGGVLHGRTFEPGNGV